MIDFETNTAFKLKQTDIAEGEQMVRDLLIDGERVVAAYREIRDMVVFTNKRVIAVNVQIFDPTATFNESERCSILAVNLFWLCPACDDMSRDQVDAVVAHMGHQWAIILQPHTGSIADDAQCTIRKLRNDTVFVFNTLWNIRV